MRGIYPKFQWIRPPISDWNGSFRVWGRNERGIWGFTFNEGGRWLSMRVVFRWFVVPVEFYAGCSTSWFFKQKSESAMTQLDPLPGQKLSRRGLAAGKLEKVK